MKERSQPLDPFDRALVSDNSMEEDEELAKLMAWLNNEPSRCEDCNQMEPLPMQDLEAKVNT